MAIAWHNICNDIFYHRFYHDVDGDDADNDTNGININGDDKHEYDGGGGELNPNGSTLLQR